MKDSHYRISLDIHSTQSQVSLPVKQGDTSRKVFISLCEGGKPYQIEDDCYAVFSARKPDGTLIENYCIIAGNIIEYTFTEQTTAVGGMLDCEIKLYGGDSGLITSPRFTVIVDARAVSDAKIESTSEYSALTNLYTITHSAASNANAKAVLANAAAENADAKAALANTAAANADAVAEETEALKTEVETKLANGEFKGEKGDKGNPGKDADYNLVSNALKGSASGTTIRLDDVSPVEHTANVKVHGKNLIDMSTVKGINGESIVVGNDSIVLKNFGGVSGYGCKFANIPLCVGKTYTFSVESVSLTSSTFGWLVAYKDGTVKNANNSNVLTVTINKEVKHINFYVAFGNLATTQDITIAKPMCELGTTATEYEPYLDPATVTVRRCGKNLLETNEIEIAKNAQPWTNENIGKVKIAPGNYVASCYFNQVGTEKSQIQLSARSYKDYLEVLDSVFSSETTGKLVLPFTVSKEDEGFQIYVYSNATDDSISTDCLFTKIMVEAGDRATEFEAFKGETYTPNADGTVDGVTSLYPTTTLFTDTEGVTIDVEYNKDANKVIDELLGLIIGKTFVTDVEIYANKWVGTASPYSQVVTVAGATKRSQVDLTPSAEQLSIFHSKDLAFVTENDNGVITVYAIGQKPTLDYTIQATVTEVNL